MAVSSYRVPGVYRRQVPRTRTLPRVRTDVAGFVGIAGPRRLREAIRVDDYRGYEETFLRDERGRPVPPPAGSRLAECVQAFFENGGARCWIVSVGSVVEGSPAPAQALLNRMLGVAAAPDGGREGLELLLMQSEVSLVALPELDATIEWVTARSEPLPPAFEDSRFGRCADHTRLGSGALPPDRIGQRRVYADSDVLWAQRYLLERLGRERWRCFGILAPPPGLQPDRLETYRRALTRNIEFGDVAALYWPWLLVSPAGQVEARSPVGYVTGLFARRDLSLGPHWAPAGEPLTGVVGLELELEDGVHGSLYDQGVNVVRAFPGLGIRLWGARTLAFSSPEVSRAEPLAYVNARRCLSAIERTAERLGQSAVFEPNRPLLRLQVAQAITGYLLDVYHSGALQGATPEEAFFVRCDSANNPPATVEQGQLLCEVGVALAVPAEFVVFRLSTNEGSTAIAEAS